MFRKPRRAYRIQRREDSDGEAEESSTDPLQTNDTESQLCIKPAGNKANLSFGDDLEGRIILMSNLSFHVEAETFKVKRPAHSRRVLKQLKEGKSSIKLATPDSPPAPKPTQSERAQSVNILDESASTSEVAHEDDTIKVKPLSRTSSEEFSSLLKRN